jgi:hypothetical protein
MSREIGERREINIIKKVDRVNSFLYIITMKYLSASEYGKKHGRSRARVAQLIERGDIPCWRPTTRGIAIAENFPWPVARKSGRPTKASKYIDNG